MEAFIILHGWYKREKPPYPSPNMECYMWMADHTFFLFVYGLDEAYQIQLAFIEYGDISFWPIETLVRIRQMGIMI